MNPVRRLFLRVFWITVPVIPLALRLALFLAPYPALDRYLESLEYSRVYLDRAGELLRVEPVSGGVRREYLPVDLIPERISRVFLASEDGRFYAHFGVDPVAVARSALLNIRAGKIVTGASTVTMQLCRIIRPSAPGFTGKLREALDALRLESKLSKKRILELWLNSLPFAFGTDGIQSASRLFFGKSAGDLTDSEAALLSLVPRRPARYAPGRADASAVDAALSILKRSGSRENRDDAERAFQVFAMHDLPFEAPHFVARVKSLLRNGAENGLREVITSIDLRVQRYAQDLLRLELDKYRSSRITTGAVLALDNRTGDVLVYIGSGSFFDERDGGQIDGVRVTNQPGSTLKPFLYAFALDNGYLPNSILPDIPTDFGAEEVYSPDNFNRRFNGPVRLRVALSSSLNVPAVRLITRLGVEKTADFLIASGFTSLEDQRAGLGAGLALGNAEVSLLELTTAFALFPRGGMTLKPRYFAGGDVEEKRVVSKYAAFMICSILSDNASRFPGFGAVKGFLTPFPAMFKTGTANQYQNIWAVGASERFTVGVWLGNFSGETVMGRTGSSVPLAVAKSVLTRLQELSGDLAADDRATRGTESFPVPEDTEEVEICPLSGLEAGDACESTVVEYLPPGRRPPTCTWHRLEGTGRTVIYPPEYERWVKGARYGDLAESESGPLITYPGNGALFYLDPGSPPGSQAVVVKFQGGGARCAFYVNGVYRGDAMGRNPVFPLSKGEWTLEIRDGEGNGSSVTISVR